MHNNNLMGTLPANWGTNSSLPRLRVAALHANHLTGTLPEGWAGTEAMQDLEEVWLQVLLVLLSVLLALQCGCQWL